MHMFGCTYICTWKCLQNVAKICTDIYLHTCTPPPSHSHLLKLPRTVARVFSGWGIEWKNMDDKEPPARQWIWKKRDKGQFEATYATDDDGDVDDDDVDN